MYTAYILFSEKLNKKYVGSSESPDKRVDQHNRGKTTFTSRGRPWILKYIEYYETRKDAVAREGFLKTGAGRIFLNRLFEGKMGYPEKEIPDNCLRYELI